MIILEQQRVDSSDIDVAITLVRSAILVSDACQPVIELCKQWKDLNQAELSQVDVKLLADMLSKFQAAVNTVYQVIQKTGNAQILSQEALKLLDDFGEQN